MLTGSTPPRRLHHVGGFTLIEVLIALVLLSVGLLGLAGLQTASLRNNQSAMNRSQAVALAYDILDRIRANRAAVSDYPVDFGNSPSGTTIADGDVSAWLAKLAKLPNGQGDIKWNEPVVTVQVRWSEDLDKSNGSNLTQTITVSTQP